MFENFCWVNYIDEFIDKKRIKFVLFTNILPAEKMLCYFNSTNVEHRSFDNLRKFLHSKYTRSCEKFRRSEPQAQKENVISEEYLKSLYDEITRLKERISIRKVEIAATRQYADVIQNDDVTISSEKNTKSICYVHEQRGERDAA